MRERMYKIKLFFLYLTSRTISYLNGDYQKSRKKILQYKDKYKGKKCFVIGNGPSLTPEDLTKIKEKGIKTFASNKVYRIFESTEWRPDFYAMVDESVADKECIIQNNKFECEAKFFRRGGWYVYHNIENAIYMNSWYSRKFLDSPAFSEEISEGVYTIATVTYVLLQIARYMGFSEIYLLGMDNKYKYGMTKDGVVFRNENVLSYFGEVDKNEDLPKTAPATWELDLAYEYADKYSRDHGFRIYNATRGGFLEKFERVSFDEVVK